MSLADRAELRRLRNDLVFERRAHGADAAKSRSAIGGYVEQRTSDRTTLHTKTHECGCEAPEQLSPWLGLLWKL